MRDYVDPQIATPQIKHRKRDAAEAGNEQVTPSPRADVRQAEYGTGKNCGDRATTGEFLQPLDRIATEQDLFSDRRANHRDEAPPEGCGDQLIHLLAFIQMKRRE